MKYVSKLMLDVVEKYKQYGNTKEEILDLAVYFAEQGKFNEYVKYLNEHFNNAFGDLSNVKMNVDAIVIAQKLSGDAKEVLWQCVDSPKFDGDVVSKSGKSELYNHGLLTRIANKQDHGDNAANTLGWLVYKEISNSGFYDNYPRK